MPRKIINKIRNAIRTENYDLTYHAVEEMAEDYIGIPDVENAVLNDTVTRSEFDNSRGTKYVIEGPGTDQTTPVGIVGRFKETGAFLIITVYEIT